MIEPMTMLNKVRAHRCFLLASLAAIPFAGCASNKPVVPLERPDVAPATRGEESASLSLDPAAIEPMYRELVAIDLDTVVRVARAKNIDIRLARIQVDRSRGRLESVVGGVFPALVPGAIFEHLDGSARATEGNIVNVGFNTFSPSIAVQWAMNPGRVVYEIIAAKKRLRSSEYQQRAVEIETLRDTIVQFYDLVLAQARVSASHQAMLEAQELLRINRLRLQTGTGVRADELRAEARLAERRQDLALAMNTLYFVSLGLIETLQLDDPTTTLVPAIDELPPTTLVREDIPIEELLALAVSFRPDLESLRILADAAAADRGATWWGAFGPEFQVRYQYAGITGHSNNTNIGQGIPSNLIVNPFSPGGTFSGRPVVNGAIREGILRGSRRLDHNRDETFSFSDQHRFNAGVSARWSLSAFGDLKTADAIERQQILEAQRLLTSVRTQVVRAQQASRTNRELIGLAQQQTAAAAEALRLTQASLRAGAMTTLDVLQAQDAVAQARLRSAGAIVRYNQAEVNLLAAIGLLDEPSIATAAQPDET